MPEDPQQLSFFHSLDFPGRTVLYLWEVAQKLGGTVQHYLNLVDSGELVAIDTGSRANGRTRRMLRIPLEEYRNFVILRLTGPRRAEFIRQLPVSSRLELIEELKASLKRK